MIAQIFRKEEGYDSTTLRTTGCGCCSVEYEMEADKEKILKEVVENIRKAAEVLALYGLTLKDLEV